MCFALTFPLDPPVDLFSKYKQKILKTAVADPFVYTLRMTTLFRHEIFSSTLSVESPVSYSSRDRIKSIPQKEAVPALGH